jgi:hypothetical protein
MEIVNTEWQKEAPLDLHLADVPIAMQQEEQQLYRAAVRGRRCVVEFGAGGSTIFALQHGARRIYSVESDPRWIQRISELPNVQVAISANRLQMIWADIGPTGNWGMPTDPASSPKWKNYWGIPWEGIDSSDVDLVLIDGRFRVASLANALLRTGPETVFVVHDFANRPYYHVVLPFLTCVVQAGTLCIFVRKHTSRPQEITAVLNAHMTDPR